MSNPTKASDTTVVLDLMLRLGQAYLACGEQTATVELLLRRTASAYGMRRSRVVAFPTALFLSVHDDQGERVTFAEGPTQTLRLDQVADLYELGGEVQRGALAPRAALDRLTAILRKTARFGRPGAVVGHAILAAGLAMVLTATLTNLAAAAALGLIVGLLKVFHRNQPVLAAPLPVAAATLVSSLVYFAVDQGLRLDPTLVLVPPLVTFLPGAMVTLGMVELAYGDMVSGSSRLMTGLVQLVLLAFGLVAGAALVGVRPEALLEATTTPVTLAWVPWAGVAVFGLGVLVHFSAPRNSLGWLLVVLYLAFGAQRAAAGLVGQEISGFFGTLVATPLSYLIQLRFGGPPAMVTSLPSFWLLVPGALGLVSITKMLGNRIAGLEGLTSAIFVFASIGLGSLVGASLYKFLTERFGAWQLQLGRVGRSFRGGKRKR